MQQEVTSPASRAVARPLKVLVPLIKDDLTNGDRAGLPYYRAAGEKMLEAKTQANHGEFMPWIKRSFGISQQQAERYMKLARTTPGTQNQRQRTLSDIVDPPRPDHQPKWTRPIKKIVDEAAAIAAKLREAELTRAKEREAERKLALQLINIGWKTLANKLHPDKGGSRDAMQRLNRVRDRLKASV